MKIRITKKFLPRGGTLIESVIATAILAVISAGVMGCVNYGLFTMRLARENARATQIILERLESLRLYNWTQVNSNGFVPTTFTDVYDPQGRTNQQGAVYSGHIYTSNLTFGTYATNMKMFTVTLTWNTFGKINHSRSISTLVARDGIQNYVY